MSDITWTYWISRDSVNGVLSDYCHLWCGRPTRVRVAAGIDWRGKQILIGKYKLTYIESWFGAERIPETDIMLFKVVMGVTPKMQREAGK
jgi:hypothetical protein